VKRPRRLLIAALGVIAMLLAAQAVYAAKGDVRVATSDPNPGGEAYLLHTDDGLVLRACDIQKDDDSVWAYASYFKRINENTVADVNGKKGQCPEEKIRATKGRSVYVKVCLADRDHENVLGFCSPWKRGRA
jgi:hypothetical protein